MAKSFWEKLKEDIGRVFNKEEKQKQNKAKAKAYNTSKKVTTYKAPTSSNVTSSVSKNTKTVNDTVKQINKITTKKHTNTSSTNKQTSSVSSTKNTIPSNPFSNNTKSTDINTNYADSYISSIKNKTNENVENASKVISTDKTAESKVKNNNVLSDGGTQVSNIKTNTDTIKSGNSDKTSDKTTEESKIDISTINPNNVIGTSANIGTKGINTNQSTQAKEISNNSRLSTGKEQFKFVEKETSEYKTEQQRTDEYNTYAESIKSDPNFEKYAAEGAKIDPYGGEDNKFLRWLGNVLDASGTSISQNPVASIKERKERNLNREDTPNEIEEYDPIYFLTSEEEAVINAALAKEGPDKARELLYLLEPELQKRKAANELAQAKEIKANSVGNQGNQEIMTYIWKNSIKDSFNTLGEGINKVTGNQYQTDAYSAAELNKQDMLNFFKKPVTDNNGNIVKDENGNIVYKNTFGSYFVEGTDALANQAPQLLAGLATGGLGTGVSTAASLGTMGLNTMSGLYQNSREEGHTDEEAKKYALFGTTKEIATELMFGIVPGVSKDESGILSKLASKVSKGLSDNKIFRDFIFNSLEEGAEEYIGTAFFEPIVNNLAYGEDINYTISNTILNKEAWHDFTIGTIAGTPMSAVNTVSQVKTRSKVDNQLNKTIKNINTKLSKENQITNVKDLADNLSIDGIEKIWGAENGYFSELYSRQELNKKFGEENTSSYLRRLKSGTEYNNVNNQNIKGIDLSNENILTDNKGNITGIQNNNIDTNNQVQSFNQSTDKVITNEYVKENISNELPYRFTDNINQSYVNNVKDNITMILDTDVRGYDFSLKEGSVDALINDKTNNITKNDISKISNMLVDFDVMEKNGPGINIIKQVGNDTYTLGLALDTNEQRIVVTDYRKFLNNNVQNNILPLNRQQNNLETFNKIANKIGAKVEYINDNVSQNIDGYVKDGVIYLNRNNKNAEFTTFKHELVHYIRSKSEKLYNELEVFSLEEINKNSKYQARKAEIESRYLNAIEKGEIDYTSQDIQEEVVADFIARRIFENDEAMLTRLANSNKTLFETIRDFIKKIKSMITKNDVLYSDIKDADALFEKIYNDLYSLEQKETKNQYNKNKFSLKQLKEDSDGNKLSKEQELYFKDSKVRDENGNLLVMYHGTPAGGFNEFKDGSYFSPIKEYSERYLNESAGKTKINPQLYSVYLNITKPFDIRNDKKALDIYINDYIKGGNALGINPYESDSYYNNIKTIDWTEGEYLRDFLIEEGYNYDGLVLDEGINKGESYIIFNPNQVKNIENKNPTDSKDIRFSLKEPIEETKDLIALHNISESNLEKTIQLGGFPMPSIAITRDEVGHSNFGDISIIFGKNTIDPKLSKNKVYSADAWTPTFPTIEYELNDSKANEIYKRANNVGNVLFFNPVNLAPSNIESNLQNRNEQELIEYYKDNYGIKQFYIADTGGVPVADYVKKTVKKEMSQDEIALGNWYIDNKKELLNSYNDSKKSKESSYKWRKENINNLRKAYKDYVISKGATQKQAETLLNKLKAFELKKPLDNANKIINNQTVTETIEEDISATQKLIDDRINQNEYENWLKDLFAGIVKSSGIRNKKDLYTPSGSSRSFSSTHYPVTVDNIVKSMLDQADNIRNSESMFVGIKTVRAAATKSFNSIKEIKESSKKIQKTDTEEYQKLKDELDNRLSNVITQIIETSNYNDNIFMAMDSVGYAIEEAASNPTIVNIKSKLKEYNWEATEKQVKEIQDIINEVLDMPVNMFEAKPIRVVGFDEILGAVIPNNVNENIKQFLNQNGIEYLEYENQNEVSRIEKVNNLAELKGAKFSLKKENTQETDAEKLLKQMQQMQEEMKRQQEEMKSLREEIKVLRSENIENKQNNVNDNLPKEAVKTENTNKNIKVSKAQDNTGAFLNEKKTKKKTEETNKKNNIQQSISAFYSTQRYIFDEEGNIVRIERVENPFTNSFDNEVFKANAIEKTPLPTKDSIENTNNAMEIKGAVKVINKIKDIINNEIKKGNLSKEESATYFSEFDKLGQTFVNDGHYIEKFGKKTKNENFKLYYNNILHSYKAAETCLGAFQVDHKGKRVGESVYKILEPVMDRMDDFNNYLHHRLNIDRWKTGKQLDDNIKDIDSFSIVQQYEKDNKDFYLAAQKVYNYIRNINEMYIDVGISTRERQDMLEELYPNYVPLMYKDNPLDVKINKSKISSSYNVTDPVKKAKGGGGFDNLESIDVVLARMTVGAHKKVRANELLKEFFTMFESGQTQGLVDVVKVGNIDITNVTESTLKRLDNQELSGDLDNINSELIQEYSEMISVENGDTFYFYQDGTKYQIRLEKHLAESILKLNQGDRGSLYENMVSKGLYYAVDTFKKLQTSWKPSFILRNFARDFTDSLWYTDKLGEYLKKTPKAVREVYKGIFTKEGSKYWDLYNSLGGISNSYFEDGIFHIKNIKGTKKNRNRVRRALNVIPDLNLMVEQIPRMTEFIKTLEREGFNETNLKNIDYNTATKALWNADDITLNFNRGSQFVRKANRYFVPFLNPTVQGSAKFFRHISDNFSKGIATGLGQLLTRAAIYGVPIYIANDLIKMVIESLYDDDDEEKKKMQEAYDNLTDYNKNSNFLIYKGDGQFTKIPKGRIIAGITVVSGDTYKAIFKGEDINLRESYSFLMEQINPMQISWIGAPIYQAINNKNYFGGDIESSYLQELPVNERYDEKTDEISKFIANTPLGKALNLSPKKVNYVIDQYSGVGGELILPFFTQSGLIGGEDNAKDWLKNTASTTWKNMWSPLTVDTAYSNKYSSEYTELKEKINQESTSEYRNKKYVDKNGKTLTTPTYLKSKMFDNVDKEIAQLYQEQSKIYNDDNLTNQEKSEKLREISLQINQKKKDMVTLYNQVSPLLDKEYKNNKSKYTKSQKSSYELYDALNNILVNKIGSDASCEMAINFIYSDENNKSNVKMKQQITLLKNNGISYKDIASYFVYANDVQYTPKDEIGDKQNALLKKVNSLNLSKEQKALLLFSTPSWTDRYNDNEILNRYEVKGGQLGYSTTYEAREDVAKYIINANHLSQKQKLEMAELAGFEIGEDEGGKYIKW